MLAISYVSVSFVEAMMISKLYLISKIPFQVRGSENQTYTKAMIPWTLAASWACCIKRACD